MEPIEEQGQGGPVEHFVDEGLITGVVRIVKTGKEASVHLCRANPSTTGERLLALKVYHPLDRRDFRDESLYRDGEWIKERRIRVALEKKTRFGREVQGAIWVNREWETLRELAEAGAPVPRPLAATQDAILMTYIGDRLMAAPQLRAYRPGPDEAKELFRPVNIESLVAAAAVVDDQLGVRALYGGAALQLVDDAEVAVLTIENSRLLQNPRRRQLGDNWPPVWCCRGLVD